MNLSGLSLSEQIDALDYCISVLKKKDRWRLRKRNRDVVKRLEYARQQLWMSEAQPFLREAAEARSRIDDDALDKRGEGYD